MTAVEIVSELDFIYRRACWLNSQPMTDGVLEAEDMRLEAGTLRGRIEELERAYHEL
jgi:hypothetical protein